jgi:transcriptional regulator with XRE-family HTH domain/quercetin dioxygenase-like cupin family protein
MGQVEIPPIGERIRSVRQARGTSLRALAREAKVSASLVSQIETGRLRPSVSTLYAITGALGVPLSDVLESPLESAEYDAAAGQFPVATAGLVALLAQNPVTERTAAAPDDASPTTAADTATTTPGTREAITIGSGVMWEVMGHVDGRRVDFLRITYEPGSASSVGELMSHAGNEYGFLLSGELVMQLADSERTLLPGDAVSFRSSTPHRFRNDGAVPAVGIWFVIDDA